MRGNWGRKCVPLQIPIGSQQALKGVIDLLTMKAYVGDLSAYIMPGLLIVLIVLVARALTVYPVYFLCSKTPQAFSAGWSLY